MAESEKVLLDRFYQEFWLFLILFVLMTLITIALIIFSFIKLDKIAKGFRIGIPIVTLLMAGLCFLFGIFFLKYYKDYVFLRENAPLHITGKVIGYSKVVSHDDLTVTKSWPIILVKETDAPIPLNIIKSEEKLEINQTYEFLYLPNTRIAELIVRQ